MISFITRFVAVTLVTLKVPEVTELQFKESQTFALQLVVWVAVIAAVTGDVLVRDEETMQPLVSEYEQFVNVVESSTKSFTLSPSASEK